MAYVEPSTRSLEEEITLEEWNQDVVDNIIAIKAQADALLADMIPVGVVQAFVGVYAPSGWVVAYGTIGDQYSGASTRANADCESLFLLLWASMADAQAPVVEGRGGSAAADWAAHKRITLPDLRGRTIAIKDDLGGSDASRLTAMSGDTIGASGGSETHTLTSGETAAHTHTASTDSVTHSHSMTGYSGGIAVLRTGGGFVYAQYNSVTTSSNGAHTHTVTAASSAADAHNNVQPALVLTHCIKL